MNHVLIQGFAVNASKIQRTQDNGKSVIVLKDVLACRGDSVMNRLHYTSEFVTNHYAELEGVLAPVGHPRNAEGELIPSVDAFAVNEFHGGAWNRNARMTSNGEVFVDIHIDERVAKSSDKGQALLARIDDVESGKSDHLWTSTGLYYQTDGKPGITANGVAYNATIIDGHFEHNAILLDELPAGGDTGFTINSEAVDVARLDETHDMREPGPLERVMTWFGFAGNADDMETLKGRICEALVANYGNDSGVFPSHIYTNHFIYNESGKIWKRGYVANADALEVHERVQVEANFTEIKTTEEIPAVDEQEIKAMIANAIEESEAKAETRIAALETENAELKTQLQANADAQLATQREAVKAKFGMSDAGVAALTGNALAELYAQTQTAAPVAGGFAGNSDDDNESFIDDLPEE